MTGRRRVEELTKHMYATLSQKGWNSAFVIVYSLGGQPLLKIQDNPSPPWPGNRLINTSNRPTQHN